MTIPARLRVWFAIAAIAVPAVAVAQAPAPDRAAGDPPAVYDTDELIADARRLRPADLPSLEARAEMGDARAQVLLGLTHEFGTAGLPRQPQHALTWFLRAAAQGVAWAEAWAGDFYFNGTAGGDRDVDKAIALYRSASSRGDSRAAFALGQIYFYGDGVAGNQAEAARWFRLASAASPALVERIVALAEAPCDSRFCVSLRQVMMAIMTGMPERFLDGWNNATREWDAAMALPESERCGLTTSDRTEVGDVQNYFCDSVRFDDQAHGIARAQQLADEVEKALPAGYVRTERDLTRPGPSTFFAQEGYPHLRVTFNITPGSAERRVTLLVGP
jgi:hypothetical protein